MGADLISFWRELSQDNKELSEDFASRDSNEPIPPYFFHYFRPDGNGLEPYFKKHPYGDEIFQRIQKIYDATSKNKENYMYFIVQYPEIMTKEELIRLGSRYIQSIRDILHDMGGPNTLFSDEVTVLVIPGECPEDLRNNDISGEIYTILGDYFRNFTSDSEFMLLSYGDCLYYMACNYDLVHYILWPLVAKQSAVSEPYAASFDLWKHDAKAVFIDSNTLHIYVKEYN